MRNNTAWRWQEGTVDKKKEHAELRYRGENEVDSQRANWKIVALVGPPQCQVFPVKILVPKEYTEIIDTVIKDLNFFLRDTREYDPWQYVIYHCGTAANIYAPIHWGYYPNGVKQK